MEDVRAAATGLVAMGRQPGVVSARLLPSLERVEWSVQQTAMTLAVNREFVYSDPPARGPGGSNSSSSYMFVVNNILYLWSDRQYSEADRERVRACARPAAFGLAWLTQCRSVVGELLSRAALFHFTGRLEQMYMESERSARRMTNHTSPTIALAQCGEAWNLRLAARHIRHSPPAIDPSADARAVTVLSSLLDPDAPLDQPSQASAQWNECTPPRRSRQPADSPSPTAEQDALSRSASVASSNPGRGWEPWMGRVNRKRGLDGEPEPKRQTVYDDVVELAHVAGPTGAAAIVSRASSLTSPHVSPARTDSPSFLMLPPATITRQASLHSILTVR